MSRHWRPEPGPWRSPQDYLPRGRRTPKPRGLAAVLVLGVAFAAVAGSLAWQSWRERPAESWPSSAIEWNAVQAVPTRAPDAQDIEWQKRAEDNAPLISGPAVAQGVAARAAVPSGARIYIIDGDTFSLGGQRIRILGMDAPETHPPRCMQEAQLGNAATSKLSELLASGTVSMSGSGHDQYGRELRQVFVNGADVAETMISAGLARSYDGGKKQGWC